MNLYQSTRKSGCFGAALLLALAGAMFVQPLAFAQHGGGGSQSQPSEPKSPSESNGNTEQQTMQNMADQSFVKNAMENDLAQIQLSELAQQKTTSDDVKQLSNQMVKTHTALEAQLKSAASQLTVDEPKSPSKKEKKAIEQLQGLSGDQFDSGYLQALAREQQQSLKLYENEMKNTQNDALLQATKGDTPVLEQNYQILQKVAQAHNVEIADKGKK